MEKEIKEKVKCSFCGKISNDWHCPNEVNDIKMCHQCYQVSLSKRDLMDLRILIKNRGKIWILSNLWKKK